MVAEWPDAVNEFNFGIKMRFPDEIKPLPSLSRGLDMDY
jgi:hypothetical protein